MDGLTQSNVSSSGANATESRDRDPDRPRKAPAYQWYPKDYETDEQVKLMTYEQEGMYRRLLDHQWIHGSIPGDVTQIAKLLGKGISLKKFLKIHWPAIGLKFQASTDGRLQNDRLEDQRRAQAAYRDGKAQAGRQSADVRNRKFGTPQPINARTRAEQPVRDLVRDPVREPVRTPVRTPPEPPVSDLQPPVSDLQPPVSDLQIASAAAAPEYSRAWGRLREPFAAAALEDLERAASTIPLNDFDLLVRQLASSRWVNGEGGLTTPPTLRRLVNNQDSQAYRVRIQGGEFKSTKYKWKCPDCGGRHVPSHECPPRCRGCHERHPPNQSCLQLKMLEWREQSEHEDHAPLVAMTNRNIALSESRLSDANAESLTATIDKTGLRETKKAAGPRNGHGVELEVATADEMAHEIEGFVR